MKTLIFGAIVFISTFIGDVFPQSKSITQTKNGGTGASLTTKKGDVLIGDSVNRFKVVHADTGYLHMNADSTVSWQTPSSGGSSLPDTAGHSGEFLQTVNGVSQWTPIAGGIAILNSVLNKSVNTTDTIKILRVPIPGNSWKDGETIEIRELFIQSHFDPDDPTSGQFYANYSIGDSLIDSTSIFPNCVFPDTCFDNFSSSFKRVGNSIFSFNAISNRDDVPPSGLPLIQGGNVNMNIGLGKPYSNGVNNKPQSGRYKNIDFTKSNDITMSISFLSPFPRNYMECKSVKVLKY